MHFEAKPARDEFTFSLQGMAAVNSFVFPPAIPRDGINRALDARRRGARDSWRLTAGTGGTRRLEAFLARYFAPGCCCSAT